MTHELICPIRSSRLDVFVAKALPHLSRARIQALVKAGLVVLNGTPVDKTSASLGVGDRIVVEEPPAIPTETLAQDIPLEILYEDSDLIVINKPAGLVVHPAVGNLDGTLVNALLFHCPDLEGVGGVERPGIVHRLDKETSGCLVAAKNDSAHRALVEAFAGRTIAKTYLALVSGIFSKPTGEVNAPIGRHRVNRQKMAVVERGGREARTGWRAICQVPGGTLVECELHTGRTHQIRVHMKQIGHPVLGDAVYGKRGPFTRHMLHAWRLGFTHPKTGEAMKFQSPIPRDFVDAGVPADFA
jgi:23S rRNA pseudouridine1911/1915/1917 synthase